MTPPPPASPESVAGIDVGKHWLDVFVDPSALERRFANTRDGRRALCHWLRELGARRVAVEPTGRYHRELHQCLYDAGVKVVLANPQRMRNFARSLGEQAKSDRIDAAMLARYARLDGIAGTAPKSEDQRALVDLLALRRKLVEQRDALRKHASETGDAAARLLASLLKAFAAKIQQADDAIQAGIEAAPALRRRSEIMRSVPGCGPLTAASLCAELPELGSATPAEARRLGRPRALCLRFRRPSRPPPHPRRSPASSQAAVHGRHLRDPLEPGLAHLLHASHGPRQAAQGGAGGGHAQAARPARGLAP